MTSIHIPSLILGSILTYALSATLLILKCKFDQRRERKVRDKTLDRLLADVAVRCIKLNVRKIKHGNQSRFLRGTWCGR